MWNWKNDDGHVSSVWWKLNNFSPSSSLSSRGSKSFWKLNKFPEGRKGCKSSQIIWSKVLFTGCFLYFTPWLLTGSTNLHIGTGFQLPRCMPGLKTFQLLPLCSRPYISELARLLQVCAGIKSYCMMLPSPCPVTTSAHQWKSEESAWNLLVVEKH